MSGRRTDRPAGNALQRSDEAFDPLSAGQLPAEKHRLIGGIVTVQLLGVSSKPGRFIPEKINNQKYSLYPAFVYIRTLSKESKVSRNTEGPSTQFDFEGLPHQSASSGASKIWMAAALLMVIAAAVLMLA
jgi:hypothetical protein